MRVMKSITSMARSLYCSEQVNTPDVLWGTSIDLAQEQMSLGLTLLENGRKLAEAKPGDDRNGKLDDND